MARRRRPRLKPPAHEQKPGPETPVNTTPVVRQRSLGASGDDADSTLRLCEAQRRPTVAPPSASASDSGGDNEEVYEGDRSKHASLLDLGAVTPSASSNSSTRLDSNAKPKQRAGTYKFAACCGSNHRERDQVIQEYRHNLVSQSVVDVQEQVEGLRAQLAETLSLVETLSPAATKTTSASTRDSRSYPEQDEMRDHSQAANSCVAPSHSGPVLAARDVPELRMRQADMLELRSSSSYSSTRGPQGLLLAGTHSPLERSIARRRNYRVGGSPSSLDAYGTSSVISRRCYRQDPAGNNMSMAIHAELDEIERREELELRKHEVCVRSGHISFLPLICASPEFPFHSQLVHVGGSAATGEQLGSARASGAGVATIAAFSTSRQSKGGGSTGGTTW